MNSNNMNPCPKCGSINTKLLHPKPGWHLAGCKDCNFMINSSSDEETIKKWNGDEPDLR